MAVHRLDRGAADLLEHLGSAGGCKGGIDRFSVPTFASTDNTHWTATYSCYGGGTKTVAYHGQVP